MGAGATTHFTHPLGTAGRVFSYPKAPRMPNPISYTRLRTPVGAPVEVIRRYIENQGEKGRA